MTKCKFKIGDRVKVANDKARATLADVDDGDIGTVVGIFGKIDGTYCDVTMDNAPHTIKAPWSIPQQGLELIGKEELKMEGHYCTEHETVFFKKGKMRGYAHPIGDTGEWCNEPEEGGAEIPASHIGAQEEDPTKKSIERQTSLKCATDWCVAQLQSGEKPKTTQILSIATLFESYLAGGMGDLLDGKKADGK